MSIEAPDQANGHPPAYVKFGPGTTDEMPHAWAQRGLTWLKTNRPTVFADMMLAVLGVERGRKVKP